MTALLLVAALAAVLHGVPASAGDGAASVAAANGPVTPRVVGGRNAPEGRIPYQLGVLIGQWKCGASLIREDVALCAAHCKPTATKRTQVVSGAYHAFFNPGSGDVHSPPRKVIIHPEYNKFTDDNDASLVFLTDCVDVGAAAKAKVVAVATPEELAAHMGSIFTFSGWGTTSTNANSNGENGDKAQILQYGYGRYVNPGTCSTYNYGLSINDATQICAGDVDAAAGNPPNGPMIQDTCGGDSGGPLVFNLDNANDPVQGSWASDRLIGITSWGTGCGQGAGVYTRAPNYRAWINMQLDAIKKPCAAADITFVQVSADSNFDASPSKTPRLKRGQGVADCQALCAAASATGDCMAFSLSVKLRGAMACNLFGDYVPSHLCGSPGKPKGLCKKASAGSYRLVYKYT